MAVRPLAGAPDAAGRIADVIPWIHEAGNPYFDWLFGGGEEARRILTEWMARETSEISVRRVHLLEESGRALGGFLALDGESLVKCRKADTLAILKSVSAESRKSVMERLKQAGDLFVDVEPGDHYLSKMGVLPDARGRGIGRRVLEAYLADGRARDCRRFVLDVSRDNTPAVSLFRDAGFSVSAERTTAGGEFTYLGMTREADRD